MTSSAWVAFGMGKNYCFYSINIVCSTLGEPRSRSLSVFHALTDCDTASAFKGKGKKTAWQAWQIYEAVTDTFVHLASHAFEHLSVECLHFQRIDRLTVIIYDRTSPLSSVNQAREELFCRESRSIDRIPPTQDALLQHTRTQHALSKLESGPPACKHSQLFLHHMNSRRPRSQHQGLGSQCGLQSQKFPEHAANS